MQELLTILFVSSFIVVNEERKRFLIILALKGQKKYKVDSLVLIKFSGCLC